MYKCFAVCKTSPAPLKGERTYINQNDVIVCNVPDSVKMQLLVLMLFLRLLAAVAGQSDGLGANGERKT